MHEQSEQDYNNSKKFSCVVKKKSANVSQHEGKNK